MKTDNKIHTTLAGNFGANCSAIMSEQAPCTFGFGTLYNSDTEFGKRYLGVVVECKILPKDERRRPEDLPENYTLAGVTEKSWDIWDNVWLKVQTHAANGVTSQTKWVWCGNRHGGVQEYAKVVAPVLAALAVQESRESAE